MTKKKNECIACTLIDEYDTSKNEEVKEEIEVIVNTYDNVRVSGKSSAHCKVHIPLVSESCPTRRVTLEIRVVPGYPYVAPAIALKFPLGVHPGDEGALSNHEVKQMAKEVSNNIQPCLPSGMPCMMQIVSTVSAILECGVDTPSSPPRSNGKTPEAQKMISPGQSPSLTPVPLKAKEALKLSMLAFHLLKKCCHMRDPESNEEANSNFDKLVQYLLNHVAIFPEAARGFIPWTGLPFRKAFAPSMDGTIALPLEQQDLAKWMWQDEGQNLRIQQSSEGRYRNEFIQQRLLGSGGFAPVYVCRKKIDGRLYAIKKVAMTEAQSEKVLLEVQTLAALNHKNIVRYYDAWVEDGCDEELRGFVEDEEDEEESEEEKAVATGDGHDDAARHGKGEVPFHKRTIVCASSSSSSSSSTSDSDSDAPTTFYTSSSAESAIDTDDDYDGNDEDEEGTDSAFSGRARANGKGGVATQKPNGKSKPAAHYQTLYIQMELCSARSLRHLIEESDSSGSGGIFASAHGEKVAVSILRQVLSVTAHTHRERIVHRDLKPDNILFEMAPSDNGDDVGTIRVADFGLARVMNGVKRVTSVLDVEDASHATPAALVDANQATGNRGSVLYCSPEQEHGLDYDFKVDEFSIGMIALEMWLAIAGKGFRERFTIMDEVWRTGRLPAWFVTWNPNMSDIIEKLVQPDPRLRITCEAVLSTAELPGDPADITSALSTVDRHGERIAGRIIQKIIHLGSEFRKPSKALRDDTQFLGSPACTDVVQAVQVVGLLHGMTPVATFDHFVPMNSKLADLNVESVVDSSGRSFAYSSLPHFATAAFLGMQENGSIGSFYQLYHRTRPYASFTTPLPRHDVISELAFEPLLSVCHLLSLMEGSAPVELIVSHAHWLQTVFPAEVGTRPPPPALCQLRSVLTTADQVGHALAGITDALTAAGLVVAVERDEYIKKYVVALLEVLAVVETHLGVHLTLVLDPALHPAASLVAQKALSTGILFECRVAADGLPLAFGCALDNFTVTCAVTNPDLSAFTAVVDISHLLTVGRHVQMAWRDSLVMDGVAVKRHDAYSLAQSSYVLEAAMQLWKGNIRACLRTDTDARALAKVLKQKHIRWMLMDGKRLVSASTNQQGKVNGRSNEIELEDLRQAVRELSAAEKAAPKTNVEAQFISAKGDSRTAAKALELLATVSAPSSACMIVVEAEVESIQQCIEQYHDAAADTPVETFAVPELAQWLKASAATAAGIVPIFSEPEGRLVFFVNYRRFKIAAANKKEKSRKKK